MIGHCIFFAALVLITQSAVGGEDVWEGVPDLDKIPKCVQNLVSIELDPRSNLAFYLWPELQQQLPRYGDILLIASACDSAGYCQPLIQSKFQSSFDTKVFRVPMVALGCSFNNKRPWVGIRIELYKKSPWYKKNIALSASYRSLDEIKQIPFTAFKTKAISVDLEPPISAN